MTAVELLGYVASVLVAVSLTMSNLRRLRWINLAGSTAFSLYGLLVEAWPVFAVNAFIAVVNVRFLWQMSRSKDAFDLLAVPADGPFITRFLRFHDEDLKRFFPGFTVETLRAADERLLVLRNTLPVGLCAYRVEDGVARVDIDYVIPSYRDRENGHFLYAALKRRLKDRGVTELRSHTEVPLHRRYLLSMGFRPTRTTELALGL